MTTQTSTRLLWTGVLTVAVAAGFAATTSLAQGGGRGRMGMGGDTAMQADMQVFRELLNHREQITRTVTHRADGAESLTESADPSIAKLIQAHVSAMSARIDEKRPIHQRDPLFAEIFKHAGQIAMKVEPTTRGVRVIETSTDAYVAKLIRAHADVISLFLANGHAEVMKNHAVPVRDK